MPSRHSGSLRSGGRDRLRVGGEAASPLRGIQGSDPGSYRGPVSARDIAVLVAAAAAVVLAAAWSARHQRTTGNRWTAQLVAGLVCGVASAVAVAVPFVDVVPDADETAVVVGGGAVVLVALGASFARTGRTRRARGQVPRS